MTLVEYVGNSIPGKISSMKNIVYDMERDTILEDVSS
jgi:hypothetical protein